jgi:hypothetical protein
MYELDLVVMVADADAEAVLKILLARRAADLAIPDLRFMVVRYPGRDAGVFRQAQDFLRAYLKRAQHALVVLDREGSGREHRKSAQEMEDDLEKRLRRNGWTDSSDQPRAAAIVLDPELEVWVWTHSPCVAQVIGLSESDLQKIWDAAPQTENGKPKRPKETLERALLRNRRPASAHIFQQLAEQVPLQTGERAFDKLLATL